MLGSDGRIYGANLDPNTGNSSVFAMNPDGSGFASLYTVTASKISQLVQGGDGRLYGIAGGGANQAVLFALSTDGARYSVLQTFTQTEQLALSQPALIVGKDGRLYGSFARSSLTGPEGIYAINTDGTGFQVLSNEIYPIGLIQGTDGRLYGVSESGTVFALNTDGTGFTALHAFIETGFEFQFPAGGVTQGKDGRLYGVLTGYVGSVFNEYLYALNTDGTGFAVLCVLGFPDGTECYTNLLQGADGLLYGEFSATPPAVADAASDSPAYNQGLIFSVATDGSDLEIRCTAPAGYFNSGLVQDVKGRLYASNDSAVYAFLAPISSFRGPPESLRAGGTLAFAGDSPGLGYSFQWLFDGATIPGATAPQLTVPTIGTSQSGYYTLIAASPGGTQSATTTQVNVTADAWLTNLSARTLVAPTQSPDDILIAGFVTAGPDGKQVLVRGVGPSLSTVGVSSGLLADPQLTLYAGSTVLDGPLQDWDASLAATFTAVGAFPLMPASADAAASVHVPPGAYTAQLTSVSGQDGIGMVEIYDADPGAPANRLVNLSARGYVGTGDNRMIGGFVIEGSTSETVLVRAVGPGLMPYVYNFLGVLGDPVLTVFDSSGNVLASIDGQSTNPAAGNSSVAAGLQPATNNVLESVGAISSEEQGDAAMVLTLPPGAYTAQVSSASGATGFVLFEVYEVD